MKNKTPPRPIEDLIGRTISGRYRVEELLAVGGMATVYRGAHIHMRKRVAIKVLRAETQGFSQLAARFEREAIVGAHVDHPHIAKATDFGFFEDGAAFLVMDYVEGVTLRDLMRFGPLEVPRAIHIARQAAEALSVCHGMGVVHRDLKPRNVMVDEARGDRVKLIDFGLARVAVDRVSTVGNLLDEAPTEPEITLRGVVFGTVAYMPPEIALGMEAVDERSDLYALGVVLYEMLSGAPPFDGDEPADVLFQKRGPVPPMTVKVAPALEQLVMRLLAPHPADRPQTAHEVVAELEVMQGRPPLQSSISTLQLMPQVLKPRQQPSWRKRGLIAIAGIAALAGAVALIDYGIDRRSARAETTEPAVAAHATAQAQRALDAIRRDAARRSARIQELHDYVLEAYEKEQWQQAAEALVPLLELEPAALRETKLANIAVALGVHLEFDENPAADPLFSVLAYRTGAPGLDVLYAMVSRRGGSRGARRAKELLSNPEIITRASPELRIALELRDARCPDKPGLFERAAREGDRRALAYLERLRSARCDARRGECCFHQNRALDRAIDGLKKGGKANLP